MTTRKHVSVAVILALALFAILVGTAGAQTIWQRFDNVMVKRFYATGPSTFTDATILGTLSAPTVTMTSDTVWTVDSLTGASIESTVNMTAVALSATTATVTSLTSTAHDGDLTVNGNALVTGTLAIAGATTLTGTTAMIGAVDVTGNLEVVDHIGTSAELYLFSGDSLAVIDGQVITPTESLLELTATGTVTASLAAAVDGQVLILTNSSNSTIVIVDTGTTRLSANGGLTQYDTLTLIGTGTSWYEIARSAN